jgi:hypothetical protein
MNFRGGPRGLRYLLSNYLDRRGYEPWLRDTEQWGSPDLGLRLLCRILDSRCSMYRIIGGERSNYCMCELVVGRSRITRWSIRRDAKSLGVAAASYMQ